MTWVTQVKEALRGYKTYLTALAAIITALVAWSSDAIAAQELVVAVFAALQTMFLRAGIENSKA